MAATSSTAQKPTIAVVDIEAAPTTVVVAAAAPRAGCKPCKTAAVIVGALIAIAGSFAAGFIARGRLSPRVTHKLTIDGEDWRGAGVLDIEETARFLIHDRRSGTKSAIVHVAAEEVDASQSVRAHFEPSSAYPQQRRLAPAAADKDKGKDLEHWKFEAVEVELQGEVVTEADVPEGARKQFLSEDGTGTFAFKLLDEDGHEIEKLECDDSMRCHKKPRDDEDHQDDEHGDEHETYTCWTAEEERDERDERTARDEHEDEHHQEHVCAIVTVKIPMEEPRTCLKDIRVPCPKGSMGRTKDGHCVKQVEIRC